MKNLINKINNSIIFHTKEKNKSYLQAYRNIKTDLEYIYSKNTNLDPIEGLKKLKKERLNNLEIYNKDTDLYNQENLELLIINTYLPKEIDESVIIDYLTELHPISRNKMDFRKYQDECFEKFGQKVDSQIILKFIKNL